MASKWALHRTFKHPPYLWLHFYSSHETTSAELYEARFPFQPTRIKVDEVFLVVLLQIRSSRMILIWVENLIWSAVWSSCRVMTVLQRVASEELLRNRDSSAFWYVVSWPVAVFLLRLLRAVPLARLASKLPMIGSKSNNILCLIRILTVPTLNLSEGDVRILRSACEYKLKI